MKGMLAIALAALLMVVVLLQGCSKGQEGKDRPASGQKLAADTGPQRMKTIPLQSAVASAAPDIVLPSSSRLGRQTEAYLPTTTARREDQGMSVVYDSGVTVWANPIAEYVRPLKEIAEETTGLLPYTDGRSTPSTVVVQRGREIMVNPGGEQVDEAGGRLKVKPSVTFRIGRVQYVIISDNPDIGSAELLEIAGTVPGFATR